MMDNNTENNNTENMNTENNETEMSMQDLMDLYENPVKIGQIIKGKIIQLDDKEAIVGLVGASHDGKLVLEETPADSEEKLSDILKVGQEIEAKVIRRPQENDSFFILSMVEMHREEALRDLRSAFENNTTIKVKVKDDVKGGVVASYLGQALS